MSGGRFNYEQYRFEQYIDDIQKEVDNSGKEIPIKERSFDNEWYEKYPEDKYYTTYTDETIKEFKQAIEYLKKAKIYLHRVDWFLSGDDGEESFHKRLKEELI